MICKCTICEKQFDSKDEGYLMLKKHNNSGNSYTYEEPPYCEDCFTEKFQCEDCGGFKNKFAMAVYDGEYCEC